ncbi:histidine kinase [Streptomyces sp. UNOC14_S4]|uniref:sensor histidine kinase n=1 Tax=Streptomyces sp. UNOC14_S4 TaxID=2872340 RepID=UPI001E512C35|nr:histidine kinase [Streptomyces sp. UNOC14_S4]MCC3772659.1 two-component sensor histidine kinase [Streptomyces sp. UNOC14_S4]
MTHTHEHSPRSEARLVKNALAGLREDLFTDAFAFRPLPPLPADHTLVRVLPGGRQGYTRWAPHAAVCGFAGLIVLVSADARGLFVGAAMGLVAVLPMLLTLFRPVGAWWLSLGMLTLPGLLLTGYSYSPWSPSTFFFTHLVVTLLVALRTRPRVAAGMWLITGALGAFLALLGRVFGRYAGDFFLDDLAQFQVLSGIALFGVVAVRGLRESKRQVAAQAAVTEVERSRRTVLEERTTIARELHDVVAHHMSVVAIQAEAAPYRVENPPPELVAAFQTIRENAVSALTELRRVLGVVRSENPDAFAAPEAPQPTLADIGFLIDNVRAAGADVELVTTGAVRTLPQGVELSAYRIVQEALSNTLRHAPGAAVRVEIAHVLGGLGLRVVNGPADRFAKASPGAGHGVLGMRERVAMLGGELTAEATPDGGYEVAAFLPVPVEPVPVEEVAA